MKRNKPQKPYRVRSGYKGGIVDLDKLPVVDPPPSQVLPDSVKEEAK